MGGRFRAVRQVTLNIFMGPWSHPIHLSSPLVFFLSQSGLHTFVLAVTLAWKARPPSLMMPTLQASTSTFVVQLWDQPRSQY